MAGVVVLDVAYEIRSRLGEPTVSVLARRFGPEGSRRSALTRRFGPGGRCLSCGRRLGTEPLSIRAYEDGQGVVTLMAYHAACAASAWLNVAPGTLARDRTWAAAVTRTTARPPGGWWCRWLRDRRAMPSAGAYPACPSGLDVARVRPVRPGESVNADLEEQARLGFADRPSCSGPSAQTVGQAWIEAREGRTFRARKPGAASGPQLHRRRTPTWWRPRRRPDRAHL